MNWIPGDITLNGQTVDLIPMSREHFPELIKLAEDKRIWEFYSIDLAKAERFLKWLELGLEEKQKGMSHPFVIYHKANNKIIGGTRFLDIVPIHNKLEIGSTWLIPEYWATEINPECKLLLLTFCFETLKTVRVQLKTDENNIRSRKAIAKIGGQFEGILRHDAIKDNGTNRNSAYFSIIDTEWEEKKAKLVDLFENKRRETYLARQHNS